MIKIYEQNIGEQYDKDRQKSKQREQAQLCSAQPIVNCPLSIVNCPVPPAARITDMHTCPMQTPAFPSPIPHVGGPVVGPGVPNVLIGKMPAAVVGDMCVCVGPPDTIVKGSATVMINGRPAARMGDTTAHGGSIVAGCSTVMIGG